MKHRVEWNIRKKNAMNGRRLMAELGMSPLLAHILSNRNIHTPEEAKKFLFPSLKDLHNPFLLTDMQKAVDRIAGAVERDEPIMIFGDYDVDGLTSTAIMTTFLSKLDAKVSCYIPDRIDEGYGLNRKAVETIHQQGYRLVITVDCGISNHEEIALASRLGMDTIVIDHHEVPERLPPATAVINQNRRDNEFPFRHLAGVGVAFNVLIALRGTMRTRGFWKNRSYPNLKNYLDLVALGTIGDLVPLTDENRVLAKIGLAVMEEGKRPGIRALKAVSNMENADIDSESAAFRLIPRLNAAGRVGTPEDALNLLISDDYDHALSIARRLDVLNRERQEIDRKIFAEILEEIESNPVLSKSNCFVFSSDQWHPGVIGIVASRLVERFYRPSLLISLKDGIGRGSGRSIAEFNLYQGLESKCAPLLRAFGGHRYAVGISIDETNISEFTRLLSEAVSDHVGDEQVIPSVNVDAECRLKDIDYQLLSHLEMLAPFGNENPEPVLCARNLLVTSSTVVGTNHLRMTLSDDGLERESIWFNQGQRFGSLEGSMMDAAFTPQVNRWRGGASIQLKIVDAVTL
ncbi:MAG: single-stranded-DNA-specific exonuclease RecJ [Syntrophales bacterium]|jgi:single-stranded-DNA-specific exonuclease|nr:single-stranded-DNA-specific exonuclease RecJ [Syntrophales bacterium]MCK9527259.1 single-stranded-DNA-specific exonuclease RecJ [Syntrophales bacterium]MDX9921271.1 single-stranded-DNA-specific exonuclease RecJ [Syntrophales bacterium]